MNYDLILTGKSIIDKVAALQDVNSVVGQSLYTGLEEGGHSDASLEHRSVTDYLNDDMDSPKDWAMKKLMASAVNIAKAKGVKLPFALKDSSPEAIASMADEGLTRVKTYYQLGTGKLSLKKAIDNLYDHAASRLAAAAGRITEKYLPGIAEKVCMAIGTVYTPAAVAAPAVKAFTEKYIAPAAGRFVESGIKKMASSVKERVTSVAHAAASKVASVGRSIVSSFKGWFS